VKYFNNDAANLLKQKRLKGANLYVALATVVNQAIAANYIKTGQDNLIVSTVTPASTSPSGTGAPVIVQQSVQQFLEKSINKGGLTGEVRIYSASGEFRNEAEANGLSPSKYLIYEQLKETGDQINIDDVRKENIRNLVSAYKLSLLPNYENITVQRSNGGKPGITVNDNGRFVTIADYFKNYDGKPAASPQQAKTNIVNRRGAKPKGNVQSTQQKKTLPVKKWNNKQVGGSVTRQQQRNVTGPSTVKTKKKKKRKVTGSPISISTDGITGSSWDVQQAQVGSP
jgi:hypothetical protein